MDRWVLEQGVFDCWGWELVNESQQVIAESSGAFGELEKCVQDAPQNAPMPPQDMIRSPAV